MDINKFSTLGKLLRVTSWIKRFIDNIKAKREGKDLNKENLSAEEMKNAEEFWIKDVQASLVHDSAFKKARVQLGIIEINGVLVCKGRLENSDLGLEAKYPIYLPKDHRFTILVIEDCHVRVHHCLVAATLAELRSRFWVSKGRQFVKKILKQCFVCRKLEGQPFHSPPTAALPEYRVTEAEPFSKVGIDFAGPLFVKGKQGEMSKVYICLFSCCVTRALHLELVQDLTAGTFLNCLRRFCAKKGTPTIINSDNAKTFKAIAKFLRKLHSDKNVTDFLIARRIQWKFNLEVSPWQGGHFERMVRSVKRCLRKVLGNTKLNFDELITVLSEVECILNSRPLTYQYDELDGEVLTPSHLMFGRRLSTLSTGIETNMKLNEEDIQYSLSKRFMHLTRLLSHFWNRWRREYLTDLREKHRENNNEPVKINIEDIVLVQEDKVKRGLWKVAIVEEIIKGKDGQVRGAKVRRAGKGKPEILNRPMQKLYPLECVDRSVEKEKEQEGQKEGKSEVKEHDETQKGS